MQIVLACTSDARQVTPSALRLPIKESKTKLKTVQLWSFFSTRCLPTCSLTDQVFLTPFLPSSRHLTHSQIPLPRHRDYRNDLRCTETSKEKVKFLIFKISSIDKFSHMLMMWEICICARPSKFRKSSGVFNSLLFITVSINPQDARHPKQ